MTTEPMDLGPMKHQTMRFTLYYFLFTQTHSKLEGELSALIIEPSGSGGGGALMLLVLCPPPQEGQEPGIIPLSPSTPGNTGGLCSNPLSLPPSLPWKVLDAHRPMGVPHSGSVHSLAT